MSGENSSGTSSTVGGAETCQLNSPPKSDVFDASYLGCAVFLPFISPIDLFCIASNKDCVPKTNTRCRWLTHMDMRNQLTSIKP